MNQTNMYFNIYDFYDIVLTRPAMFVGENSISKVAIYLSGANQVLHFKNHYENKKNEIKTEVQVFHNWICDKLGTESFHDSCTLLKKKNNSESLALDELIVLYKDFRGTKFGSIFNSET